MTQPLNTEWLQQLPRLQGKPGLERINRLLDLLGNPQNQMDFVHVAGTNGKGTVCTFVANILKEAGYKTGLTISPYVLDFRERFQINGEMISIQDLERLAERVRIAVEQMPEGVAQFEAVTALALLWFYEQGCQIGVLETGLGGRYDATNVVSRTLVAAITRIDLDHTELLGDTLEEIAAEKAGIIKPGCTVVSYPLQDDEVQRVIVAECIRQKAELIRPNAEDIRLLDMMSAFENRFDYGGYLIDLNLLGAHQVCNAVMAVEIALALWRKGYEIDDNAICEGLKKTTFPARLEVMRKNPIVLLDGAHNPAGVAALVGTLESLKYKQPVAVIGMMADKNCEEMLRMLLPHVDRVYTVTPCCSRAMSAAALADCVKKICPQKEAVVCDSVQHGLELALQQEKDLLICGSLYLAAEARPELEKYFKK